MRHCFRPAGHAVCFLPNARWSPDTLSPAPDRIMAPGPDVAEQEGLRYVSDARPGITRVRRGRSFVYFDPQGRRVGDPKVLARVRGIGVPPAYRDVWICPHADGHI